MRERRHAQPFARAFGGRLRVALEELLHGERIMPFKSQAQRRKFAELLVQGKISNDTFEEWNRETGGRKLPERVGRETTARAKPRKRNQAVSRKRR